MSKSTEQVSTADEPAFAQPAEGETADSGLEEASGAGGGDQVQREVDEAEEKGYYGHSGDPTPRDHYSVQGVISGKPTPETDSGAAEAAYRRGRELSEKLSGTQ